MWSRRRNFRRLFFWRRGLVDPRPLQPAGHSVQPYRSGTTGGNGTGKSFAIA